MALMLRGESFIAETDLGCKGMVIVMDGVWTIRALDIWLNIHWLHSTQYKKGMCTDEDTEQIHQSAS
jgi:hypothetical protein